MSNFKQGAKAPVVAGSGVVGGGCEQNTTQVVVGENTNDMELVTQGSCSGRSVH